MSKQEFLDRLGRGLRGLPAQDVRERLAFYGEMIDDRVEEGLPEAEAVAAIGPVDDVVSQILAETPLARLVKERIRPKSPVKPWVIVLLILGAPLWIPLLIAVLAVLLAAYAVVWSALLSLWAVQVSVAAGVLSGVASAVYFAVCGKALSALAMLSMGLLCAGSAILLFFGCLAASKGVCKLTKKAVGSLKHRLMGKENAQ